MGGMSPSPRGYPGVSEQFAVHFLFLIGWLGSRGQKPAGMWVWAWACSGPSVESAVLMPLDCFSPVENLEIRECKSSSSVRL